MKRITLNDIAAISNYSVRTVKKVVSGNGRVSDNAREAILDAIEKTGYKKNEIASTLAKNEHHHILIMIYLTKTKDFIEECKLGFIKALDEYEDYGIGIEFAFYSDCLEGKQLLKDAANRQDLSAVIIHVGGIKKLDEEIDALVDSGIPVFTFNSDAPNSKRRCFLGPKAYESGRIGAQILANYISQKGNVFVMYLEGIGTQTIERSRGFCEKINEAYPEILISDVRIPNNPELYYEIVKSIVLKQDIKAFFCTDTYCRIAASALRDLKRKDIVVLGFDITEESKALMRDGYLTIVIDQNTSYQAYTLLKLVAEYLLFGYQPPEVVNTEVSILISEFLR